MVVAGLAFIERESDENRGRGLPMGETSSLLRMEA
jgi:hypothetical protein